MLKRCCWVVPVLVALAVYYIGYANFFVYDDFVWLYRAKTLTDNWRQMFAVDVLYFDPLVYLSFLADFWIAGLNPVWYQLVDLALHAANACLVYHLALGLSQDRKASTYAGVFFAASFAAADAVFWPSSRVDLISALFTLASLIQYLRYLRGDQRKALAGSIAFFILALGAKGTPAVVPVFLVGFCYLHRAPLRRYLTVFPFLFLGICYLVLVKTAGQATAAPLQWNINNLCLGLCELFIPERHVATLDPVLAAAALTAVVLLVAFGKSLPDGQSRLRAGGFILLAGGLVPVVVIRDFKLATECRNAINLLSSPSHRIYLASVGSALLTGGLVRWLEERLQRCSRCAAAWCAVIVTVAVACHAAEVRERYRLWHAVGIGSRAAVDGLISHRDRIVEDGVVGLVQFPGSNGFMTPMVKVFLDVKNVTTCQLSDVGRIPDSEVVSKASRSALFVLGSVGSAITVYDFSDHFRSLLCLLKESHGHRCAPASALGYHAYAHQLNRLIALNLHR